MKRAVQSLFLLAALAFFAPARPAAAGDASAAPLPSRILIEFFYEPGCKECDQVRADVLPALEAAYADRYDLQQLDLGIPAHYARLAAYFDRFGNVPNAPVYMVLDRRLMLAGYPAIASGLFGAMEERLAAGPDAADAEDAAAGAAPAVSFAERVRRFTLAGVVLAGMVDGINPCAISTLVFFISLLAVAKVRGRTLLVAGAVFCAACFLTYFAIGFGMLRALHLFSGFHAVRETVNWIMIALLLAFAFFSFRDAWRYKASRDPSDVTLQLPDSIKNRIHRVMREELKTRNIAGAALVIGIVVTVLEAVCTGQVYVPTLVYVVKSGEGAGRGLLYLLVYNFMFVLPLLVVFALTYAGLEFRKLMAWSVRNVVISKIALGVFFLGMAALILVL